jgi:nucleotide-binding universal stress UspA family protein
MFKLRGPILVAMDLDKGSDEILRQADLFARSYHVKLSVCHVLPEIFAVRPLYPQLHLEDSLKLSELEAAVREEILKRVRKATNQEPNQIDIEIEQGTVHAGILRAAENIGAGAVVIGGKVDHTGSHILSGAAGHVVRYANCPVLVARNSLPGRVLTATDFSDPALPAVEAGATEARHRKADLTIMHVVDLVPLMNSFYGDLTSYSAPPVDIIEPIRKMWQQRLDECVQNYKAKGGGILSDGPASSAIVRAAAELPAELLVVGTHGRTGMSRIMALGSVAEAVVRSAPCSVLIVRLP